MAFVTRLLFCTHRKQGGTAHLASIETKEEKVRTPATHFSPATLEDGPHAHVLVRACLYGNISPTIYIADQRVPCGRVIYLLYLASHTIAVTVWSCPPALLLLRSLVAVGHQRGRHPFLGQCKQCMDWADHT